MDAVLQRANAFHYIPLTRHKEIRILYFDEDDADPSKDRPVALRIKHVTLAEVKETSCDYTALSYVWGTDTHDKVIKIDGLKFQVTQNLETALQNIGSKRGKPFFWIDAICINQNDGLEKNSQVAMMGEIYSAAIQTLVWLGECNPAISEAIDMLGAANVAHDELGQPVMDLDLTVNNLFYINAWKGVEEMLAAPWWRRMWVIQEIALGQKALVMCGAKMLMFQRLALGADFAFKQPSLKHMVFPSCKHGFINYWRVHNLMQYRMKRQQGDAILLQELLENNTSCEATDPRDMVFSLFGLATDTRDAPELVVNYQMPVENIYASIVNFQIRKYRSLDMICQSVHPKKHANLPSWVPDFSNRKENLSTSFVTFCKSWPGNLYSYAASGLSTPDDDALAHGPSILRASAIFVDKIVHVGEVCSSTMIPELMGCLITWLKETGAFIGFAREYIGGGSVLDAFNRTICGDKARSGLRAPKGWRGLEALEEDLEIPDDFRIGPEVAEETRREAWVADAIQAVALRSSRRRLIITATGHLGLGPPEAKIDDFVSLLLGCSVPVILRPKGDDWWFVGESFVCGIMDGEILEHTDVTCTETEDMESEATSRRYQVQKISLV